MRRSRRLLASRRIRWNHSAAGITSAVSAWESPSNAMELFAVSVKPCLHIPWGRNRSGSVPVDAALPGGTPTRKPSGVRLSIPSYAPTAAPPLRAMATRSANTAPAPAMASQRRCRVSKQQASIHYRTAMAVFRKWLAEGIITEEELTTIGILMAQKYGLPSHSIYR